MMGVHPFSTGHSYYRDNSGNLYDERGLLLPFLAGVLVTTPFVFLAKNQNQPNYSQPYPYNPYMNQPYPYPVQYMSYSR